MPATVTEIENLLTQAQADLAAAVQSPLWLAAVSSANAVKQALQDVTPPGPQPNNDNPWQESKDKATELKEDATPQVYCDILDDVCALYDAWP